MNKNIPNDSEAYVEVRIDVIKSMTDGNKLKSIVDYSNYKSKKSFQKSDVICKKGHELIDNFCSDIRCVLEKKLLDINKVMKGIECEMIYVKSGSTGHTFMGINKQKNKFAIKVVAFPKKEKYGNLNDVKRPENAELLMIRVLSYFVVNNHTPHIVLPISTFNSNISSFVDLKEKIKNKRFDSFVKSYNKGTFYDYVSILVSEWANGGDLLDYIRNNYSKMDVIHWKIIFFQILSVLAVIQNKYPSFRHNDLKANNILVHYTKNNTKNTESIDINKPKLGYLINDTQFIIPDIDIQLKIWDFDFACIPSLVDNTKVSMWWTNEINICPIENKYYDMHYFFNTLIRPEFFQKYNEDKAVPNEVREFINRIVPDIYKYDNKTNTILSWLRKIVPEEYKKVSDEKKNHYKNVKEFIKNVIPDKFLSKKNLDELEGRHKEFLYFKSAINKIIPKNHHNSNEFLLLQQMITCIEKNDENTLTPFKLVTEKGRILINTEFTTPYKVLLDDPFFKIFRKK